MNSNQLLNLCILNIMCHLPYSWETKSSNECYRDEIWVADVEPGKGTETSLQSWNTTSKTCFPLTFQSAVPQAFGEKRDCCFFPSPSSPHFLILYFWTILYLLLSLIICTLCFNICLHFGSHLQSLALSSLVEMWQP